MRRASDSYRSRDDQRDPGNDYSLRGAAANGYSNTSGTGQGRDREYRDEYRQDARPGMARPAPTYSSNEANYDGFRNNIGPQGGAQSWSESQRGGSDGQSKRMRYDNYDQPRASRPAEYAQQPAPQYQQQYQQSQDAYSHPQQQPQHPYPSQSGYDGGRDSYRQEQQHQQHQYSDNRIPQYNHREDDYRRSAPDHRDYSSEREPTRRPTRREDDFARKAAGSTEPPSASVVFLGLPAHCDNVGLRIFLEDMGASIDETTIIMDRVTGLSRRYGFAKFSSVEHARAFVEPNFPTVAWKEPAADGPGLEDGLRVRINFSQKTAGWRQDQGSASRFGDEKKSTSSGSVSASAPFLVNDGTRDIGSAPTQILLLRGLDPLTREEDIVRALEAIPGRTGSDVKAKGIKRVMITKDRASRSSWGFAFVQFSNVQLSTDILASVFNTRDFPTGFKVRSSVIALSFCHENSFIPIYAQSEWSFKGEGGQQLAYWDDKAFVSAWSPKSSTLLPSSSTSAASTDSTKTNVVEAKRTKAAEDDMEAFFSSIEAEIPPAALIASSTSLRSIATSPPHPTTSSSTTASTESKRTSLAPPPPPPPAPYTPSHSSSKHQSISSSSAAEVEDQLRSSLKARKGSRDVNEGSKFTLDKKKNDLIETKKAAVNISKWNTKQQELNTAPIPPSSAPLSAPIPAAPTAKVVEAVLSAVSLIPSDALAFADVSSNVCLLCQRQFKDLAGLEKHTSLSALHKTNLASPSTVAEAALRRIATQSTAVKLPTSTLSDPSAAAASTTSAPYIDRSAARREAFDQPDAPKASSSSRSKRHLPIPPAPAPLATEQPNQNGIEASNVGSKMLAKMGWSQGDGLGAERNGITAPVIASSFPQGAGLGSSKGVAVGTYQPTAKGYAEQLRDAARERLEKEK